MSVFRDGSGNEWRVTLDAFVLDDVRKQTGIDLADLSAGGWYALETDASVPGRVLAVVCAEELKQRRHDPRTFSRTIRGAAIDDAVKALVDEGADFFPLKKWCEIQSALVKRKETTSQIAELRTVMVALEAMPPEMRAGAAQALAAVIETETTRQATTSPTSQADESASGPEGTPSTAATS